MNKLLFILTSIGILFSCALLLLHQTPSTCTSLSFKVYRSDSSATAETIFPWSSENNNLIIFLPSYADMAQVEVSFSADGPLFIGGIEVHDGTKCNLFSLETDYPIQVGNKENGTLRFVQSANVAAMYISTVSSSMNRIHADKSHKEYAQITLISSDGELDYCGGFYDKLRGRGNTTWNDAEKKPYNLYLMHPSKLLGMSTSQEWALLANAFDPTNLRDKLIYDFASSIGRYEGFAPQCEFVDLYTNGEYAGLYLLCEKATSGILSGNTFEPEYLFSTELLENVQDESNAFYLNLGIGAEIAYPPIHSENQIIQLKEFLQAFQAALLSSNAQTNEGSWLDYIDMDSWARKYLIEEIFENYDAGAGSNYFILNSSDQKLYAGPCWDYDTTLGSQWYHPPQSFLAQREWKNTYTYTPWFHALWQKDLFREYVLDLYRTEFLPKLNTLIAETIPNEFEHIAKASMMNAERWFSSKTPSYSIEKMTSFLNERIAFLNSAWIEGINYQTIALSDVVEYVYISVESGTSCSKLPSPETLGAFGQTQWYRLDNGQPFDSSDIVTEDLILTPYKLESTNEENSDAADRPLWQTDKRILISILSIFSFLIAFSTLIFIDLRLLRESRTS